MTIDLIEKNRLSFYAIVTVRKTVWTRLLDVVIHCWPQCACSHCHSFRMMPSRWLSRKANISPERNRNSGANPSQIFYHLQLSGREQRKIKCRWDCRSCWLLHLSWQHSSCNLLHHWLGVRTLKILEYNVTIMHSLDKSVWRCRYLNRNTKFRVFRSLLLRAQ